MSLRSELEFYRTERSFGRRWVTPITASLLLVILTTAVLWRIEAHLKQDHLIFIYFIPTALIAIRYGSISAVFVAIVSSFAAAFFFYAPQFSFFVADPLELMELVLFGMLALLASQVVSGFANDRLVIRRQPDARKTPKRRGGRL
jgi:K+-sensing histidine kinase KdpD